MYERRVRRRRRLPLDIGARPRPGFERHAATLPHDSCRLCGCVQAYSADVCAVRRCDRRGDLRSISAFSLARRGSVRRGQARRSRRGRLPSDTLAAPVRRSGGGCACMSNSAQECSAAGIGSAVYEAAEPSNMLRLRQKRHTISSGDRLTKADSGRILVRLERRRDGW